MNTAPQILIVEDDPMIGRMMATMLKAYGYPTHHASSAEAAVDALQDIQPALVTLDLNLPGMSGGELLQQLRASPAHAGLPVIVVTAYPEVDPATRGLADAVLVKPFGMEELIAAVQTRAAGPAALMVGGAPYGGEGAYYSGGQNP